MATKKQKRERGIARREAFEAEQRERNQHFLKLSQDQRTAERKAAEEARIARAKAKSKKLAKQHRQQKEREAQGITEYRPAPINIPRPQTDSGLSL